jgi:hypothetical protein
MAASDYVDQAVDALGGEDTEFYLNAKNLKPEAGFLHVVLSCRYQGCGWSLSVGEMDLWEFITDAREHWETAHAAQTAVRR